MIRRFVEEKYVSRANELSREAESPSFPTTQLLQRLRASTLGIEAKTLQNCINAGCECISALPIESLEILVVFREHLGSR